MVYRYTMPLPLPLPLPLRLLTQLLLPEGDQLVSHGAPGRRVIENKHSNLDRSMAHLLGECSY